MKIAVINRTKLTMVRFCQRYFTYNRTSVYKYVVKDRKQQLITTEDKCIRKIQLFSLNSYLSSLHFSFGKEGMPQSTIFKFLVEVAFRRNTNCVFTL